MVAMVTMVVKINVLSLIVDLLCTFQNLADDGTDLIRGSCFHFFMKSGTGSEVGPVFGSHLQFRDTMLYNEHNVYQAEKSSSVVPVDFHTVHFHNLNTFFRWNTYGRI